MHDFIKLYIHNEYFYNEICNDPVLRLLFVFFYLNQCIANMMKFSVKV